MNTMMEDIRTGIMEDRLEEIEGEWLVDELKYFNRKTMNIGCDYKKIDGLIFLVY